jgi:hypothetical protein
MRHVDVRSPSSVKYVALSYTWGASTETFPFECDNQDLSVRQNLLLALSRLKKVADMPLWIDAMCINQDDEAEKMVQIQMMTDIYRRAEKVLVRSTMIYVKNHHQLFLTLADMARRRDPRDEGDGEANPRCNSLAPKTQTRRKS